MKRLGLCVVFAIAISGVLVPNWLPGVCLHCVTADEPADDFQTAAQRRLYRILIGRSEKSRANVVSRLALSPEDIHSEIEVLVAAAEMLLQQRADELAAEKPDTRTRQSGESTSESLLAMIALIAKDPSPLALPLIQKALHHEDDLIAMAAMDAVGSHGLDDALDDLTAQIKRPEFDERYAYRFALVRAIAQLHDPRAIEWLQKLYRQLDGQLRHEIQGRLADVDLRDFDGDAERLRQWQDEHPISAILDQVLLDIEPPVKSETESTTIELQPVTSSSGQRPKLARNQYYGIDLHAARMLFIIDRSGSMREPAHYGTRLQRAKTELVQTINGLSSQTQFGIMAFDTTIGLFRDELVDATDENKRAATAFVDRIMLGQKTNTHGALVDASDFDDQLEAVFLLTDGRPTFGKVTRPDLIIEDMIRRNRTRHLKFHTIGIGDLGNTVVFLKTLAEETGGEFKQVP
ncbi:VWA domain-containing protein [Neorhodopirellula pilleata]|uniref:von Willebrand factor type A domain protein n=1 Tax=Neorhodopirellula pilleata TaxID=2714738 RepID=A0A5C6APP4_9BACT|nr:VWA domain-containing protein [Neorhodopirellula pilleata]TWU01497.1 von Willebrand factor type A domain protein [Neorhodopirellula pilleata]